MLPSQEPLPWLPLGSAHIIDWKQLGRPGSARGATAWVARVSDEPVLLRSWSNESTTFYEFYFLAYEELNGTLVISTSRPDPARLRLQATVDIEGRLGYSDISEFSEHPQTGLYGSILRTVEVTEGEMQTDTIANPTAAQAEIFEYAPESALQTSCGSWIHSVLECVRAQLLDGEEHAEAAAPVAAVAPPPAASPPPPPPAEKPASARRANRKARATMDGPAPPAVRAAATPPEPPKPEKPASRRKKKVGKLTCTTNSGESFDVTEDETFIGRSKQCTIVLKSQRVSRKHASVTKEADGFFINDLGAANGIWAGQQKIDREKIENGAEYIIGDVLISFVVEE